MWPWGHLGAAYLCYTAYTRARFDRPPLALPVIALAVGSQFPDLVDKPLAWTVTVLPGGRTLGHSLLFAAVLVPTVYAVGFRYDRVAEATAFVVGHLSHLAADVPPSTLAGDASGLAFVFWPLVEAPSEEPVDGILDAIFTYYTLGPYEIAQFGLFVLAALVWYRDATPGLGLLRRWVSGAQSDV